MGVVKVEGRQGVVTEETIPEGLAFLPVFTFARSFAYFEVKRCERICSTYSDLDLIGRVPSPRVLCGLGGLDPEKKGAIRASALAAR